MQRCKVGLLLRLCLAPDHHLPSLRAPGWLGLGRALRARILRASSALVVLPFPSVVVCPPKRVERARAARFEETPSDATPEKKRSRHVPHTFLGGRREVKPPSEKKKYRAEVEKGQELCCCLLAKAKFF